MAAEAPGLFRTGRADARRGCRLKNEIHVKVAELANDGAAVLLISSEIEEILTLSDRVLVMNKGRIVAEVGKENMERQNLMALCVGEEEQ